LNGDEDKEMNITCFIEDYVKTNIDIYMEKLSDTLEAEKLWVTTIEMSRPSDTGLLYSSYLTYRFKNLRFSTN